MIERAENIYNDSKQSLESLLRKKSFSEVTEELEYRGIDINDVSDIDIESLVAAKVEDMMQGIKGFGKGAAFAIVISLLTGI